MKKIILLMLLIPCFCFGQKIEENKYDEFTDNSVMRTSWEDLCTENHVLKSSFNMFYRISRINDHYYFDVKLGLDNVFSISDKDMLMLKLENDFIIKLENTKYKISEKGGAFTGKFSQQYMAPKQGVYIHYMISKEQLDLISKYSLTKIRVYTTDGYYEKDVKMKNYNKFKKSIGLITSTKQNK